MRIRITAESRRKLHFPFQHQHALVAIIYDLFNQASPEYAAFLHDIGYRHTDSGDTDSIPYKSYKMFTFSRLSFNSKQRDRYGFRDVSKFELIFSSAIDQSYESLVLGLFEKKKMVFNLGREPLTFYIENIESLPQPLFASVHSFVCRSPIVASTMIDDGDNSKKYYLNYGNEDEQSKYIQNVKSNLIRKYELLYGESYQEQTPFQFRFDPAYLIRKPKQFTKIINLKKNSLPVRGNEAPFTIQADPELIQVGYDCGFGEHNGVGFGCVELLS